jgi:Matrixin
VQERALWCRRVGRASLLAFAARGGTKLAKVESRAVIQRPLGESAMRTLSVVASLVSLVAATACGPASELSFENDAWPPEHLGTSRAAVLAGAGPSGEQVVFVNFEGGVLSAGNDEPRANRSSLLRSTTQVRAYQSPASIDRQASIDSILTQVRDLYSGYRVLFTTTRPASLPYTMVMVGGRPQDLGMPASVTGTSPLDCGNETSGVAFVFSAAIEGGFEPAVPEETLTRDAIVIAHETAHTFGLEHSSDPTDVMAPALGELDVAFRDSAGSPSSEPPVCGANLGSIARLSALVGLTTPAAEPEPAPQPLPAPPGPHHERGNRKPLRDCPSRVPVGAHR